MNISKTQPSERVKPQGSGYNELTEAERLSEPRVEIKKHFADWLLRPRKSLFRCSRVPQEPGGRHGPGAGSVREGISFHYPSRGSTFYTWFYRILMNGCIDFSRREAKRKRDVDRMRVSRAVRAQWRPQRVDW